MYARGILFGKMKYELGDHSYVRCPENNLSADIEFKVKGWVSGGYNAIGGYIKNDKTGENLFELSGTWNGEMYAKDLKTGKKTLLFNATHAKHSPPKARPFEEQGERESQRLWREVCKAVHIADHAVATDEKAKIEDRQRQEAKEREEQGIEWQPKLFRRVDARPGGKEEGEEDLEWIINADMYVPLRLTPPQPRKADQSSDAHAKPDHVVQQILSIAPILPGQKPGQQNTSQQHSSKAAAPEPAPTKAPATASAKAPVPPQQSQAPAPAPAMNAPSRNQQPQNDNLIDFGGPSQPQASAIPRSQPQPGPSYSNQRTSADPIAGNPMHPTSDPKQLAPIYSEVTAGPGGNPPPSNSLMDDDRQLNDRMSGMSMQQPLNPTSKGSGRPIKRTDTETSEPEVFVDAQG